MTNPGDFIPKTIEEVLSVSYNPPFYRNQLLADAMVFFHMIETAGNGIKTVYRIQKAKFFPMPDYDFMTNNQVSVTVYGKTIDDKYTYMLFKHQELPLETVYLLDQVQKGHGATLSKEAIQYLRNHKLVEGRKSNLYLSAEVSQSIEAEAQYIKNKGFNDQYYKDMIVRYLHQYGRAKKKDLRSLIWDKLPDVLTDKQKNNKLTTLLTDLRKKSIIKTSSPNQQRSYWILVK